MKWTLKRILNEFYRENAVVQDEYQRGDTIDFEWATITNANLEDVGGTAGDYLKGVTTIPSGETVTVESGEGMIATSLDVQGTLDVKGELATVGDDDHRDWSY